MKTLNHLLSKVQGLQCFKDFLIQIYSIDASISRQRLTSTKRTNLVAITMFALSVQLRDTGPATSFLNFLVGLGSYELG